MLVSIVIPCYHSAKSLPFVVEDLRREFSERPNHQYEIILVNDCSTDETLAVIRHICDLDQRIVGVDLSRNFGQASAQLAGVAYATGKVVVLMDDDGQHPASGVFSLIEKIQSGYDVVYAKFNSKRHSLFKRLTSQLHGRVAELTGIRPRGIRVSSFVAWSRFAADAVKSYDSPFPAPGAFLYKVTGRIANVELPHQERIAGKSGYTLRKLFALWVTAFTNFSIVPLRAASLTGAACAAMGMLFAVFLIFQKLAGLRIAPGYTSIIAVLLLVGGLIMIMLGLIGEYLGRIYMALSRMPQYSVRETINLKQQ